MDSLANSNCAKEQKALLTRGPPVNLFDKNGFPEAGDNEIFSLLIFSEDAPRSAKLEGSLLGEERLQLWEDQKKFFLHAEKDDAEGGGRRNKQTRRQLKAFHKRHT